MIFWVKDVSTCHPGCDNCGEPFLTLGKMQSFPDTNKGRREIDKLVTRCSKRLIKPRR